MGREFELKYQAKAGDLEKIRAKFGDFKSISMETTYYDTPLLALRSRRWTLRRRLENGVSVCTVKTPLPDGSRGEWEVEAPDVFQGLPKLIALGAPEELAQIVQDGVAPFCAAWFVRLAKLLPTQDGTVELALDKGVLLGGGKELPFAEVEVELKSGSDRAAGSEGSCPVPQVRGGGQQGRLLLRRLRSGNAQAHPCGGRGGHG